MNSALQVNFGKDRNRACARSGKPPSCAIAVLVVSLNVLARAGDGQFVEQLEERGTESLQQVAGLALAGCFVAQRVKVLCGRAERFLEGCRCRWSP